MKNEQQITAKIEEWLNYIATLKDIESIEYIGVNWVIDELNWVLSTSLEEKVLIALYRTVLIQYDQDLLVCGRSETGEFVLSFATVEPHGAFINLLLTKQELLDFLHGRITSRSLFLTEDREIFYVSNMGSVSETTIDAVQEYIPGEDSYLAPNTESDEIIEEIKNFRTGLILL